MKVFNISALIYIAFHPIHHIYVLYEWCGAFQQCAAVNGRAMFCTADQVFSMASFRPLEQSVTWESWGIINYKLMVVFSGVNLNPVTTQVPPSLARVDRAIAGTEWLLCPKSWQHNDIMGSFCTHSVARITLVVHQTWAYGHTCIFT